MPQCLAQLWSCASAFRPSVKMFKKRGIDSSQRHAKRVFLPIDSSQRHAKRVFLPIDSSQRYLKRVLHVSDCCQRFLRLEKLLVSSDIIQQDNVAETEPQAFNNVLRNLRRLAAEAAERSDAIALQYVRRDAVVSPISAFAFVEGLFLNAVRSAGRLYKRRCWSRRWNAFDL